MFIPMPGRLGRPAEMLPLPFRRAEDQGAWRFHLVPVAQDLDAGEYGLLDPRLAEEPELPRDGLLNAPYLRASEVPARAEPAAAAPQPAFSSDAPAPANGGGTGGLMETFGFVAPGGPPSQEAGEQASQHLQNVFRALFGLGPARDDLIEDERGNTHAPEVYVLIQDIVAATKADEPALRRRIDEMFRGEARTAYWFHLHLSDLLAGDPPEEILESLSDRADERFRDQRASITHLSGLVDIPAVATLPSTRPFTHLNDPVPPDPNMEEFRRLMQDYDLNREARAWERAATRPDNLKSLWGTHRQLQGDEFEDVARGFDTARGANVGPSMIVERPDSWREFDYTLLDRLNMLLNPVEAKSGGGRIPKSQRVFDATMNPPVVYRKERDVLSDGLKMLTRYDRLWMLRNPPQSPDRPTGHGLLWPLLMGIALSDGSLAVPETSPSETSK